MNRSTTFALASMPAVAGFAWRGYRQASKAVAAHLAAEPHLPGHRREISAPWGSVAYRLVEGDNSVRPLVLIHGWGKTADSAWWPLMAGCGRTMVVVDLPGHGESQLVEPFSFALAAQAVEQALSHSGVSEPIIVAHSMGGPVAFSAIRGGQPRRFAGLVVMASSAYWVRPRLRAMMTMAPYAMAPRSPFLLHTQLAELSQSPELAPHIAWGYSHRPPARVLSESAAALRRFDARPWSDLSLPTTRWIVPTLDTVLAPRHQYESAQLLGGEIFEIEAQHSMVLQAPERILRIIDDFH